MNTAFASDFDGTLFFRGRTPAILPEDLRAIRAYRAAGGLFGFCTGRPIGGLLPSLPEDFEADFYICSSGSQILDAKKEVLFERAIPFETAREIYGRCEDAGFIGAVHLDGRFCLTRDDPDYKNETIPVLPGIDAARDGRIHDISFLTPSEETAGAWTEKVNALFGDAVTAFRNVRSIDIAPRGCSKGQGLHFLREYLNIKRIAGIGDSMNDLPLIEAADVSFTFSHAPEGLKSASDHIVCSVGEALSLFA